jgi:hypothetical protein
MAHFLISGGRRLHGDIKHCQRTRGLSIGPESVNTLIPAPDGLS